MMIDLLSILLPTPMILPPMTVVRLSVEASDVAGVVDRLSPAPAPLFWALPGVVPPGCAPVADGTACAALAPCWLPKPPSAEAGVRGGAPAAPANCSVCGGFRLSIS